MRHVTSKFWNLEQTDQAARIDRAELASMDAVSALPLGTASVVRLLQTDPLSRGQTVDEIAWRLHTNPLTARRGMAWLAAELRSVAGVPTSPGFIEPRIALADTFDVVMADFGSAAARPARSASPDAGMPVNGSGAPQRIPGRIFLPKPSVLATMLRFQPGARRHPTVRRWMYLHGRGVMDARGLIGAPAGTAKTASPPTHQWFWKVESGQNPSLVTKKITGKDTRYPELIAANPAKATVGSPSNVPYGSYNFKSFMTGEDILIPKSWNQYIYADGSGATGGVPLPAFTAPPLIILAPPPEGGPPAPGDTYTSTLPAGAITAIKLQLGVWEKAEKQGLAYPGPFDVNDTIDEKFLNAVRKFQLWSNARGAKLRTDGRLDKPTHDALNAYTAGAATKPPPTDIVPGKPPDVVVPGKPPAVAGAKAGGDMALPLMLLAASFAIL